MTSATAPEITGTPGTSWHGQFWNPVTDSSALGFQAFTELYYTYQVVQTESAISSKFVTSTVMTSDDYNGTYLILLYVTFNRNIVNGNDYLFDVIYDNEPSSDLCQLATVDSTLFDNIKYWLDNYFYATPSAFYFYELDSFIFYANSVIQLLRTDPLLQSYDLPSQFFKIGQKWNGTMKALQYANSIPIVIHMNYNVDNYGTIEFAGYSFPFYVKIYGQSNITALYFECDGKELEWFKGSLAVTENGEYFYYGASASWFNDCPSINGVFILQLMNGDINVNITKLKPLGNYTVSINESAACDGYVYIDPDDSNIGSDDGGKENTATIIAIVMGLIVTTGCTYCCKKKCCQKSDDNTQHDGYNRL